MGSIKKITLILAIVALIVGGTSIAFGYTPPSTTDTSGTTAPDTQCLATKQDYDGNLTLIDATTNDVGVDLWWRGSDLDANIENWTLLRDGVFNNTYPALAGALWTYSSECTPEQVDQLFATHVAERQADPNVPPAPFLPFNKTT